MEKRMTLTFNCKTGELLYLGSRENYENPFDMIAFNAAVAELKRLTGRVAADVDARKKKLLEVARKKAATMPAYNSLRTPKEQEKFIDGLVKPQLTGIDREVPVKLQACYKQFANREHGYNLVKIE